MQRIQIGDSQYADINGKTFKLLRAYQPDGYHFDPKLLQITGKFTLMKEDLPNKDWRIHKSVGNGVTVYTAYDKKYAMFDSQAENRKIIFFAASFEGAMTLSFTYLAHYYGLDVDTDEIELAVERYSEDESGHKEYEFSGIKELECFADSGINAVMVRFAADGYTGFDDTEPSKPFRRIFQP